MIFWLANSVKFSPASFNGGTVSDVKQVPKYPSVISFYKVYWAKGPRKYHNFLP